MSVLQLLSQEESVDTWVANIADMGGMIANAFDKIDGFLLTLANAVHNCEDREIPRHATFIKHDENLLGSQNTLSWLTTEQLGLQSTDRLVRGGQSETDFAIATSIASGDEVGHTTTLQEGWFLRPCWINRKRLM